MPPKDDFLMQFLEAKFAGLNERLDRLEGLAPRLETVERDIAKYKNRFLGVLVGGSMGSGAVGAWIGQHLASLTKLLN